MLERFTDLDKDLAVGSYPHAPEHVEFLRDEAGVSAVVCLQSDDDFRSRGIQWPILWRVYTTYGLGVQRVPIRDLDPKDFERHIDLAVEAIAAFVHAERKTYVHCTAGLNRSPTAIIAFLIKHRGLTLEEALAWTKERHACVPYSDILTTWVSK
jgi:hypothetical protein